MRLQPGIAAITIDSTQTLERTRYVFHREHEGLTLNRAEPPERSDGSALALLLETCGVVLFEADAKEYAEGQAQRVRHRVVSRQVSSQLGLHFALICAACRPDDKARARYGNVLFCCKAGGRQRRGFSC